MNINAKQISEMIHSVDPHKPDPQEIAGGLLTLISQIYPVARGIEILEIDVQEDGIICIELAADSKPVFLYFYIEEGCPYLGVDWDNDDDIDEEFDLSELNPPMVLFDDAAFVDLRQIDSWMDQEVFQNIVFHEWDKNDKRMVSESKDKTKLYKKESTSLDDWEADGSDGTGPTAIGEQSADDFDKLASSLDRQTAL